MRAHLVAVGLIFAGSMAHAANGIDVMRGCFADGPFSFSGKHYTITDYNGMPKPLQGACPPILMGGGGKLAAV